MLESIIGSSNPAAKFNLQTSTSKLLFAITIAKTVAGFMADFENACAGTVVSATRYSEDKGTKDIFSKMNLQDLAEIAAMNEGYILAKSATNDAEWKIQFSVELSNAGSVKLSQKDFITLQFAGFSLFTQVQIYSLGAAMEFDEHLKISPVSCAA